MPLTAGGIYYADNSTPMSIADITAAMATSITNAVGATWTSYTPAVTGATYGTGSLYYSVTGKTMRIVGRFTVTSVSGGFTISFPSGWNVDTTIAPGTDFPLGNVTFVDAGTALYPGVAKTNTVSTFVLAAQGAGGTYLSQVNATSTIPFTWASGDSVNLNLTIPVIQV